MDPPGALCFVQQKYRHDAGAESSVAECTPKINNMVSAIQKRLIQPIDPPAFDFTDAINPPALDCTDAVVKKDNDAIVKMEPVSDEEMEEKRIKRLVSDEKRKEKKTKRLIYDSSLSTEQKEYQRLRKREAEKRYRATPKGQEARKKYKVLHYKSKKAGRTGSNEES